MWFFLGFWLVFVVFVYGCRFKNIYYYIYRILVYVTYIAIYSYVHNVSVVSQNKFGKLFASIFGVVDTPFGYESRRDHGNMVKRDSDSRVVGGGKGVCGGNSQNLLSILSYL